MIGFIERRRFLQPALFEPLLEAQIFECSTTDIIHLYNYCPMCSQEIEVAHKSDKNKFYFEKTIK